MDKSCEGLYRSVAQLLVKEQNVLKQIRSMMRISLEDLSQDKLDKLKGMGDRRYVVNNNEPCLTCGRHKRMQYTQRMDGKLFLIEECLYCLVRVKTATNRANQ